MTDCREIEPLIEKLSDGETSADEERAAKAHLATCRDCRLHLEFLISTGELARRPLPEPPESYWEQLPRRVLARIDERPARGWFSSFVFAPSTLRWGAAGATLIVVAAVSLTVMRETNPPAPAQSAARMVAPHESPSHAETALPAAPATTPPMARDEAGQRAQPKSEPPIPEDLVVAAETERILSDEEAREVAPAAAAPAPRAMMVAREKRDVEDCEELRGLIASSEDSHLADARYALALCSLNHNQRAPAEDLRLQAIEDAEAFLALESEGPRADEIRERKRLLEK